MNRAIKEGWKADSAMGEPCRLHRPQPRPLPIPEKNIAWQAWKNCVPVTYHISIGTDIIHQAPHGGLLRAGRGKRHRLQKICVSVSKLDGGAFLNFGSAIMGPEIFLKALSISRNLGYQTFRITTANFDLIELVITRLRSVMTTRSIITSGKNIVNRPVSRGGKGFHFVGDHK